GGTAPNNAAVIAALVQTPYNPAGSGAVADMTLSVDPAYGALLQAAGVDPRRLLAWLYQQVPSNRWPPWVAGA
ncbi:MAG TPA: hypothetical protein VNM16_06035, partial [Bacillota bacterium]|nr:hypothetical protein [Bacillota bacterium]